jgi:hypothetical protein
MNRDLDAALHDLAEHAAATHRTRREDGTGVSTAAVTHRVRHHRRVRASLTAATALVAVAGVVLAGTALADRRDPLPADSPTVAPSPSVTTPAPTPSETTPAVVLPTGDPSLPFGECGSLVGAAPAHPVTSDYQITLRPETSMVAAGQALVVHASRERELTQTPFLSAVEKAPARGAVLRDGVTVAVSALGSTERVADYLFEGTTDSHVADENLLLTTCIPVGQEDVRAGVPLPAGEYTLQAWSPIVDLGEDDYASRDGEGGSHRPLDDLIAERGVPLTVIGDPVTITVTGQADTADPEPGSGTALALPQNMGWPECGDPAPDTTTPNSFRLTTPLSGSRVTLEDGLTVAATFEYTGPGSVSLFDVGTSVWLVQDGQVVGNDFLIPERQSWWMLGSGVTVGTQVGTGLIAPCLPGTGAAEGSTMTSFGTPVPPGEYQAYLARYIDVRDVPSTTGTTDPNISTFVFADPFTLVVE